MKTALALIGLALFAGMAFANLPVTTTPEVVTPEIVAAPQGGSCGPLMGQCATVAPDICDCDEPQIVGTCEDFNGRSWYIADCGHPVEYCFTGINCIP